ncbi:MAG: lysophospholipid acyltransferase family protein [Flammeovirgaceae bacterium]|nr:lysophospholipid acyltransferase family protein [Flammeovirgaceae bacterium]
MAGKRPFKKRVKYFLLYHFVRFVVWVARVFPRNRVIAWFGFLGKIAYLILKKERLKVHKHLRMAFKNEKTEAEYERIAQQTFVNLGRNAVDVFRYAVTKDMSPYIRIVKGKEHLEEAARTGKGIIGITGHCGSYDTGASFIHQLGYKINIVGAPLKDERLNKLVYENRVLKGAKYIPRGGSSLPLIRALKAGEIVFLLIDQDIPKIQGIFVDFFGMPAYTPVGAAMLAMKTGATVLPLFIRLNDENIHEITIEPPVPMVFTGQEEDDLRTNTQAMTNVIEAFIRKYPEQWVWMHERWKTQPADIKR